MRIYATFLVSIVLPFGHLERKSVDDWVSACRGLVVEGARGRSRSKD